MDLRIPSVLYSLSHPPRSVWQIRNSCKYVVYKDKREFIANMKNIYNATNKELAATELYNLEKKWGGKYPYTILS